MSEFYRCLKRRTFVAGILGVMAAPLAFFCRPQKPKQWTVAHFASHVGQRNFLDLLDSVTGTFHLPDGFRPSHWVVLPDHAGYRLCIDGKHRGRWTCSAAVLPLTCPCPNVDVFIELVRVRIRGAVASLEDFHEIRNYEIDVLGIDPMKAGESA